MYICLTKTKKELKMKKVVFTIDVTKVHSEKKLQMVKMIKEQLGLGLKDAKELCDEIWQRGEVTYEVGKNFNIKRLIDAVKEHSSTFSSTLSVKSNDRLVKIMSLGMCDKDHYLEYMSENFVVKDGFIEELLKDKDKSELTYLFNKYFVIG